MNSILKDLTKKTAWLYTAILISAIALTLLVSSWLYDNSTFFQRKVMRVAPENIHLQQHTLGIPKTWHLGLLVNLEGYDNYLYTNLLFTIFRGKYPIKGFMSSIDKKVAFLMYDDDDTSITLSLINQPVDFLDRDAVFELLIKSSPSVSVDVYIDQKPLKQLISECIIYSTLYGQACLINKNTLFFPTEYLFMSFSDKTYAGNYFESIKLSD